MNQPVNILLVDDELRNLDVLESVLQSTEYRMVRASNAEDALLALLTGEFAVLVLDIQMPGMSGLELANFIKQREKTQHIPIIFLTALYQDERRMLESYNVGAVDYLTKPVNPQVLRSKVAVFVDLFRKTAALQQTNAALEQEILQRQKAEQALRDSNDELEARVEARTAALKEAHAEAERAGRAKDEFLAALSHELRTPLNPVLLIASDAAANPDFAPEARAHFATIRKNVELEARLIDDLLDLTRITRGKMPLDLQLRDVHGILHDAISTVQGEIEQKHIILTLDLAAPRSEVAADNVRIQQVFWNVLKNAVKFTPENGSITVTTRLSPGQDAVVIAIADTGIGLSAEEIARVFDAFSQGDHALGGSSHRFGGLGLGLTISRSLVEHHHGKLRAESAGQGQGATFLVELPLASATDHVTVPPQATEGENGDEVPPAAGAPRFTKILLVEDHEPTRKALEALLRQRGYDVKSSASLAEARALAAAHPFEVLVSDIGLPDGNGSDLMADLKEKYGMRGVALTGYGMEEDIDRSRNAGFTVHLTKPILVQSLDKALAELNS
jgi:signal transduction histidine kinase